MGLAQRLAIVGLTVLAPHPAALAQDYPARPITLVLPLGAGGAMDIIARTQFEPQLRERLGKPVIVPYRSRSGSSCRCRRAQPPS